MPSAATGRVRFTLPPRAVLADALLDVDYGYGLSNYYGSGPIARAKRRRFQIALDLALATPAARAAAGQGCAIDMGSADGVFIPTLSRTYRRVVALEHHPQLARYCAALIERLRLGNAVCIENGGMTWAEVAARIGEPADIMFLLETLEHIGAQPDIWGSKMAFLRECFTLLRPGAPIVISVPRMVGPIVIVKSGLQRLLGLRHDGLTWRQLLASGLLGRTEALEAQWTNISHVGFNHRKLERHLAANFRIVRRRGTAISVFYAITSG